MQGRKIKIVHIVQSSGGVERYLCSFLKYCDRGRYEIILIASNDYKKENYNLLVDVFENIDMIRDIKIEKDFVAIKLIRKLLKKYEPDIIYCHSSKAGALGRIANIGLHNQCIYNPHGWAFNMRNKKIKQITYAFIEKVLAVFCTSIVCISESEKESALSKKICPEKKISVIYNGIDFDEYDLKNNNFTREKAGIPQNAFVVGAVGRLSEQKAPDVFVKMARLVKKIIPQAFFVMVGDGSDRTKIESLISMYEMKENFLITGWTTVPMDYIKLLDVAVLLSRWEGFGLVLPEYMLAEKPIVATKVDAIQFIISDRENGLLVSIDDYRAAAKRVIELYNNPILINRVVNTGKKVVIKKFNVKRVVFEHEKLFENLVQ